MKKDVIILAAEESLVTLVSGELAAIGYTVGTLSDRECSLLIADADTNGIGGAISAVKHKRLLFISRRPDTVSGSYPVLSRPVRASELRSAAAELLAEKKSDNTPSPRRDVIRLDPEEHSVVLNSTAISLSQKEFLLFSALFAERGSAVARKKLSEALGSGSEGELEVYICLLRKKLETGRRRLILTERGVGYKLI